jgi:hypothetical protein
MAAMDTGFLLFWLAGMPGVIAASWRVLPMLLEGRPLPASRFAVCLASAAQSAVLLALAAWAGTALAHEMDLHAPFFEAAADGVLDAGPLHAQWLPGLAGGAAGAVLLLAFARFAPPSLAGLQERFTMPLSARLLYGGITEEILVRWGLMTVLAWLLRQVVPDGSVAVWLSIVLSALAFGALHLPVVSAMLGTLSVTLVLYIVLANAAFGIIAGILYWRHGLEAAVLAHVLAHLGAYAAERTSKPALSHRFARPRR